MSTQINITVDSGGLSERAKQQQQAARQAQLEKERTLNLSAEALDKRVAAQAAKGLALDGQSLYAAAFQQPKVERRPAANRSTAPQLLYYHSSPPTFDVYKNTYGYIKANKKQSIYEFTSAPILPTAKSVEYFSSGGPYNQSYVSAFVPVGNLNRPEVTFSNVASSSLGPSYMPVSLLEPSSNFTGYTVEMDFLPGEGTIDANVNRITATVVKWWQIATSAFPFHTLRVTINPQYTGTDQNIRVDWPYPGSTISSFKVSQNMPLNLRQWNRIAITITGVEVKIFVNGVLFDSITNNTGFYNSNNALWPEPLSFYSFANCSFQTRDTSGNIGSTLNGLAALSAAKITPKILYTQNYTPGKIT